MSMVPAHCERFKPQSSWGSFGEAVGEWLEKASSQHLVPRLWQRDAMLWSRHPDAQKEIHSRLGWLEAPSFSRQLVPDILASVQDMRRDGFRHIVLLGMGGSSLAPAVFQSVLGPASGYPSLLVLDSTDPGAVRDAESAIDLERTLFVVSSKSGSTVELLSLFKYFYARVKEKKAAGAGPGHFVAITDPGSPLEKLSRDHNFRKVFLAPPDVGGRFSALTYFGLVPAALIGADIRAVLEGASDMASCAGPSVPAAMNPALELGVAMAVLSDLGRDKLTLWTSPGLESLADWIEQLVAESSGKEEVGIVPVVREAPAAPSAYGQDRTFTAILREAGKDADLEAKLEALRQAGHPVSVMRLSGAEGLGAEFFRWEMATAVACALLKVNAFDQPDVQSAKTRTAARLKSFADEGAVPLKESNMGLETFWENVEAGDVICLLAYLPDREPLRRKLYEIQSAIRDKTRLAVTAGFGPRYLHSTGQLHKGGPGRAGFILITAEGLENVSIPGEAYGFADLELAQAMGDFDALEGKGRWVYHARLKGTEPEELARFGEELVKAASPAGSTA